MNGVPSSGGYPPNPYLASGNPYASQSGPPSSAMSLVQQQQMQLSASRASMPGIGGQQQQGPVVVSMVSALTGERTPIVVDPQLATVMKEFTDARRGATQRSRQSQALGAGAATLANSPAGLGHTPAGLAAQQGLGLNTSPLRRPPTAPPTPPPSSAAQMANGKTPPASTSKANQLQGGQTDMMAKFLPLLQAFIGIIGQLMQALLSGGADMSQMLATPSKSASKQASTGNSGTGDTGNSGTGSRKVNYMKANAGNTGNTGNSGTYK